MLLELYERRFGKHLPPIRARMYADFAPPPGLADQEPVARHRPERSGDVEFEPSASMSSRRAGPGRRRPRLLGDLAEAKKATKNSAISDGDILKPDVREAEDRRAAASSCCNMCSRAWPD